MCKVWCIEADNVFVYYLIMMITQFECSGKRDRTEFVDIQSFNDAIIRKGN